MFRQGRSSYESPENLLQNWWLSQALRIITLPRLKYQNISEDSRTQLLSFLSRNKVLYVKMLFDAGFGGRLFYDFGLSRPWSFLEEAINLNNEFISLRP